MTLFEIIDAFHEVGSFGDHFESTFCVEAAAELERVEAALKLAASAIGSVLGPPDSQ